MAQPDRDRKKAFGHATKALPGQGNERHGPESEPESPAPEPHSDSPPHVATFVLAQQGLRSVKLFRGIGASYLAGAHPAASCCR